MITPLSRFRQMALALALLLLPQMAHADALGAVGLGSAIGGGLAIVAVLFLVLLVVAYLRDAPRLLLVLLALSFIFGQFPISEWLLFGRYNPFASFCLPLGAWLLGVIKARRAGREVVQLLWMGVAIAGLRHLLGLGAEWGIMQVVAPGNYHLGLVRAGYLLVGVVLGLGSWWIVLRQLRLEGGGQWWQPWWRAPAIAAAVGAACISGFVLLQMQDLASDNISMSWVWFGQQLVETAIIGFITGVLALRLIPPPAAPPAASAAVHRDY